MNPDKLLHQIKKRLPKRVFRILQPVYHFVLSWLAAVYYGRPSNELIVIGVTGTTGKTTSVYLIAKTLEQAGYKTGFTSTAMFNNGRQEWLNAKKMTMPGRFYTQKILRSMVKNNCRYAVIESTSEGVVQFRHRFINYDVMVFTGLYPEHIESHGSFQNYKQAKGELFAHLMHGHTKYVDREKKVQTTDRGIRKIELDRVKKAMVINGDDEHSEYFLSFPAEEKVAYTSRADYRPARKESVLNYSNVRVRADGLGFDLAGREFSLQLLGGFNITNAMNAVAVAYEQGVDWDVIKPGIESIRGVAGRLERVDEGQEFAVIVDYAFEPNAVAKLYAAVDLIPHQRVIHVLGAAGGGRDTAKRPALGEMAGQKADLVILTNEDPYDDDPRTIVRQIGVGAEKAGKKPGQDLLEIMDRREAIARALAEAGQGDVVLITGKGSEQAICVANGEKIPWDDRAVVRSLLHDRCGLGEK